MNQKKILVIDDDTDLREALQTSMQSAGYDVLTAADGEGGLLSAFANKPDLILLDISMPKMNGLDFLRALKNNKIPIIITSNLSSMDTISEGVELGVRGYIVKSNESTEAIAEAIEGLFVVAPPKKL